MAFANRNNLYFKLHKKHFVIAYRLLVYSIIHLEAYLYPDKYLLPSMVTKMTFMRCY